MASQPRSSPTEAGVAVMRVLGTPVRWAIVEALQQSAETEAAWIVQQLAPMGCEQSIWRHLRILEKAGLVRRWHRKRRCFVALDHDALRALTYPLIDLVAAAPARQGRSVLA